MRVLQINLERGWRGGERQTLLTLQGLREAGMAAELLARQGSALALRAEAAGLPVHAVTGPAGMAAWLLCHRGRYAVFHAQTAQAMSMLAFLRGWLGGAVVFTRRTAFAPRRHAARTRWKWSRADVLVAISEAAAQAPRALGLPVRVVPSAVPEQHGGSSEVAALRDRLGLHGRTILLVTAALSPEKDPLTLVEAVARVARARPDILCLHCGADGEAGPAARARVAALGLDAHYRYLGFEPQLGPYLASARVFVSTSRFEALGTSVLDACLAGVPVVATAVGGHLESLAQGRGRLCPPGDPAAIADAILAVLDDPEEAARMAGCARAFVRSRYAVPAMVQAYLELYAGLAGAAPGPISR